MTDTLTRLTPFLVEHFLHDYAEDVPAHFAHNNYRTNMNILTNPDKFPKANFSYCEKLVAEIPAFWPEVLFQNAA